MSLEIQWFIYALVKNDLLTLGVCRQIFESIGGNATLEEYAQAVLDHLANELSEEEAMQLLEQFQAVMTFATGRAEGGAKPDIFKTDDEKWDAIPSLENVSNLTDEEAGALMMNLLKTLRSLGASDLHISAQARPFVRKSLNIEKISEQVVSAADAFRLNTVLLTPEQRAEFEENMDLNLALEVEDDRFRASLMMHKDGCSGSYRLIPDRILSLEKLGFLPHDVETVERLLDYHNGLILVTGPIGSGKTTTLAAMVDVINHKRQDHVITVEDPIEIIQVSDQCNITQRQIGIHTNSYNTALKGALREDPDVIVIGELHDLETIENAITASETGHLVIGTLHTCDAANTLNRILDVFPPSQQPQIRAMTAGSLRGIICQRLVPDTSDGLTVAYELLVNNLAVSNTISEGKTHRLTAVMQTGTKAGMCTFSQNLLNKFMAGAISEETARKYMNDEEAIKQLTREVAIRGAREQAKQ